MKIRTRHDTKITLAASIVTGVLAAYVFVSSSPGSAAQLPSSGIPLYDGLARLINADLQANDYKLLVPDDYIASSGLGLAKVPGRISSDEVLGWQRKYSDDPRYWQLCWLLRAGGSEDEYLRPEVWQCQRFSSAWEQGIGDESSCYLMLLQSSGPQSTGIIQRGRELWPDNAFWHYSAAEQSLASGDWQAFISAMETGNSSPRLERPSPWPLSLLSRDSGLPQDPDSLAVQGVLAQIARSQREGAMRSPTVPLALHAAEELDAGFVDQYVLMQVRIAQMRGNGMEQLWRPAASLNRLLSSEGLGRDWSDRQRARLTEMRQLAAGLATRELDHFLGAGFSAQSASEDVPVGEDIPYHRDQQSWINTLQSYRLDQARAIERSADFTGLLETGSLLLKPAGR